MRIAAAIRIDELTEKEWSAQVASLARALGWRRYHTYRSERSSSGFPDEVLVRDRVVYLELKTERGKLSATQRDWLNALINAGVEAYIARPRDLEALGHVLQSRTDVLGCDLADTTRKELLA